MNNWHGRRALATWAPAAMAVGTMTLAACGGAASSGTATVAPTAAASDTGSATTAPAPSVSGSRALVSPAPHQTESNPPGDIPDQQVFVAYSPPGSHFSVKVPEGWARNTTAEGVTFSDKLNSITLKEAPAASAPSATSVTSTVIPQLARRVPAFTAGKVSTVTRTAGQAVLVTYLGDSPPDPVTDKVVRDAFERYSFWRNGHEVVLTLSGPQGADNVDPWKIVTDSLRWQ